jgi:osmoprotectant transport system permease protein
MIARFAWQVLVAAFLVLPFFGCRQASETAGPTVKVGSKSFTESDILGELVRQLAHNAGAQAEHRSRLGDTSKTWEALLGGQLDVYPEYTGTLTQEILAGENLKTQADLQRALDSRGLRISRSLGFRNNYGLGMPRQKAQELGIRKISDLVDHPNLRVGLSHAILERADGWRSLKERYGLPQRTPEGMEHSLAYKALANGSRDVVDVYTTDAEILRHDLVILEDDKNYFPAYDAVLLYRADLAERAPGVVEAILRLQGAISAETMQALNAKGNLDKVSADRVAAEYLSDHLQQKTQVKLETRASRLLERTKQHLYLVSISLFLAILTAVPLGVVAARHRYFGQLILAVVGGVQTFPALALLSLLVVFLPLIGLEGIGATPAIIALYLYSLLPIVRNTHAGLHDIPPQVRESAEALGLSSWARLRLIELPLAMRSILAGVKTAAVINVGFATLGGLIGAGGYGQSIMTGLDKNDYHLILEGAIPAVILALLVQGLFELAERFLVSRGLRLQ